MAYQHLHVIERQVLMQAIDTLIIQPIPKAIIVLRVFYNKNLKT